VSDVPARAGRFEHRRAPSGRNQTGFTSYYGLPVLHRPTWQPRDIAGYLFLGGLAGTSSVVGAAAQATGRTHLARVAKSGAAVSIGLSMVALVHDLGRPSRFLNMLRIVKVTSPMNMGSWLLSAFAPAAALAAASDLSGKLPRVGAAATIGAAVTGPGVAAYTAALMANTAVPAWHGGYRQMPFLFVSSGASAASGLALLAAPREEIAPIRRLAAFAGTADLVTSRMMVQNMGLAAEAYRQGRAGRYWKAAEILTGAGVIGAGVIGATPRGRRSRWATKLSGAALLAGSATTRFGLFHAGVQSTEDPRYTVVPQRAAAERAAVEPHGRAPQASDP